MQEKDKGGREAEKTDIVNNIPLLPCENRNKTQRVKQRFIEKAPDFQRKDLKFDNF